jgi:ribosomal silencing factor RsfS
MSEKDKFSEALVYNAILMWLIATDEHEIYCLETLWRRQARLQEEGNYTGNL